MNRRTLLVGLFAAPAIIRTPGLLMAIKPVREPLMYVYTISVETSPDGSIRLGPLTPARLIGPSDKFVIRTLTPIAEPNVSFLRDGERVRWVTTSFGAEEIDLAGER